MSRISDVINQIANKQTGRSASREKIEQAEKSLGLTFAYEYREYLTTFGVLITDCVELTNVEEGISNVCTNTEHVRKRYQPFPNDLYVVFYAGVDDIVVLQNGLGAIYFITSEHELMPAFESLSDFLSHIELEDK